MENLNLKVGGTGIGVLLLAGEARGRAIEWNWAKRIKLPGPRLCLPSSSLGVSTGTVTNAPMNKNELVF